MKFLFGRDEEFIHWIRLVYSNDTTRIKMNGFLTENIALETLLFGYSNHDNGLECLQCLVFTDTSFENYPSQKSRSTNNKIGGAVDGSGENMKRFAMCG